MSAPISNSTLACGSPKVIASKVKLKVFLVGLIFRVSEIVVQGSPLKPSPATIDLLTLDQASKISVYVSP